MRRILQACYSSYVWIMIVVITFFVSTSIMFCAVVFYFLDPDRRIPHKIGNLWGKALFAVNPGWKLKIQGRGYIRKGQSYILVSNHASFGDIVCIYCLGKQFKWVAKESLFKIPFFGWAMSALKYVRLTRGKHGSIRDSFDECTGWLKRDMSLLIFPEGTRSESGKLGAFKNGAFKLAIQMQKPIIPIVVSGTRELVQKKSWLFSFRTLCRVKILKPIQTTGYREDQYNELKDLVRSQMLEVLNQKQF